jgi:dihydroorotase
LGKTLDQTALVDKLAIQPRQLFDLVPARIAEGGKAEFTLFQPNRNWTFQLKERYSKSANSPLDGLSLNGWIVGVINNGQSFFR